PAGGNPIHKHLNNIPDRHPHSCQNSAAVQAVVNPVLIMMLISSLMMQPGGGTSFIFPLCIVRAPVALIISAAYPEFCPAVFGKIMQQPLPVQPHPEAIFHYKEFMLCDRAEVSRCLHHFHPCLLASALPELSSLQIQLCPFLPAPLLFSSSLPVFGLSKFPLSFL